ncbi:UAA transporter [Fistulina hepatica ATCC 64428]|uniref:UAA transporter n=1 Tax=Fistulina hepatica ATCC 64428 TaxID=1128425 RepID=A0A0D7AF30_9AGAR|nr:UAA transporter [Fistulina hepatica ATCC 64428]
MSDIDAGVEPSQAVHAVLDYYSAFSLVLGGCCANVWAYEELLIINPRIGSALTFSQILFITLQSLPTFVDFRRVIPRLKPTQVPLREWIFQVALFASGSLINNWVYAYRVPLPIMIVFRSAGKHHPPSGLPVSMLLGLFVLKKRYTITQVASVVMITTGVILATLSRSSSKSKSSLEDAPHYVTGVALLVLSLFLTGILGLLQERTYRKYGPHWREGIFYTHFFALPIFIFLITDIKQGLHSLYAPPSLDFRIPYAPYFVLAANLGSQLICVRGVNKLSSQVSSVATNLVLTVRKALSLCFSVWWFSNPWSLELVFGAGMVFTGGVLFSNGDRWMDTWRGQKPKSEEAKKER